MTELNVHGSCGACGANLWRSGCYASTTSSSAGSCVSCPANSQSVANTVKLSATACKCNAGYTGPDGGTCTACEEGKYKPLTGSGTCTSCPAETYSPAASGPLTDCTCNAGYFGALGGPCTACVAGKYRAWSAASSVESNCLHCDSGKYSPAASGACLDCEVGKRAPDKGMGACIECEHGNRCRARISAIPCAAGEL